VGPRACLAVAGADGLARACTEHTTTPASLKGIAMQAAAKPRDADGVSSAGKKHGPCTPDAIHDYKAETAQSERWCALARTTGAREVDHGATTC
jgi:hypothetical protein